jgi:hypothetical protein
LDQQLLRLDCGWRSAGRHQAVHREPEAGLLPRKATPTFIVERPLAVWARDEREMLVRLELASQLSNAFLGESLRRLDIMRESLAYGRARAMPKTTGKKQNKERAAAFAALSERWHVLGDGSGLVQRDM